MKNEFSRLENSASVGALRPERVLEFMGEKFNQNHSLIFGAEFIRDFLEVYNLQEVSKSCYSKWQRFVESVIAFFFKSYSEAPVYKNCIVNNGCIQGNVTIQMPSAPEEPDGNSREEGNPRMSPVLQTERALELLNKGRARHWLDDEFQPVGLSLPKMAILASVISSMLELSPRWGAFERLWGVNDLAHQLSVAQRCEYYSPFLKEVEKGME